MWIAQRLRLKTALDGLGSYEIKPPGMARSTDPRSTSTSRQHRPKWQLGTSKSTTPPPSASHLTTSGGRQDRTARSYSPRHLRSFERFIAILTNTSRAHSAVARARADPIVTVTDRVNDHARTVVERLATAGVRVMFDDGNWDDAGEGPRRRSLQKIPYTIVIGDKEVAADQVSGRTFGAAKRRWRR